MVCVLDTFKIQVSILFVIDFGFLHCKHEHLNMKISLSSFKNIINWCI